MSDTTPVPSNQDMIAAIAAARRAHGEWKNRLQRAVETGQSDWTPEFVEPCGNCDFGKWLDSLPETVRDAHFRDVYTAHAKFHIDAAYVLRLALDGKRVLARQLLSPSHEYSRASAALSAACRDWSTSLEAD